MNCAKITCLGRSNRCSPNTINPKRTYPEHSKERCESLGEWCFVLGNEACEKNRTEHGQGNRLIGKVTEVENNKCAKNQ